jgi:hypothetical protein
MTELNPKLVADLARLAARYPPRDWQCLIEYFEDDRRRAQLGALLRELAATSRARTRDTSKGVERRPGRAPRVREALDRIRVTDPARANLLEDVWLKLRERELLPTMSTLRAFAEAAGFKGLTSAKREQAVTELMERLIDVPNDALESMTRHAVVEDRKLGEEYERWVQLILRRGSAGTDD